MAVSVQAGAQAPERFQIQVAAAPGDTEPLDLTTVSAASLRVTGPDGQAVTWSCTTVSVTSLLLVLEHVFAASDVGARGQYSIVVQLTVPTGVRRTGPIILNAT